MIYFTTLYDWSYDLIWLILRPYMSNLTCLYDWFYYLIWFILRPYMIDLTTLYDWSYDLIWVILRPDMSNLTTLYDWFYDFIWLIKSKSRFFFKYNVNLKNYFLHVIKIAQFRVKLILSKYERKTIFQLKNGFPHVITNNSSFST